MGTELDAGIGSCKVSTGLFLKYLGSLVVFCGSHGRTLGLWYPLTAMGGLNRWRDPGTSSLPQSISSLGFPTDGPTEHQGGLRQGMILNEGLVVRVQFVLRELS